jgi:hypothetical protein
LEQLEDRVVPSLADGTLLVANFPNPRLSSQPSFTGIVGVNPATGAQFPVSQGGFFSEPTYVCEGANGQIYVTDLTATGLGAVIRVDPTTGTNSVFASGGAINGPNAIAFVNGYLYVATEGNATGAIHDLIKIDPNMGNQLQVLTGNFHVPTGMVPVPGQNAVYVADEQGSFNTPPPLGRVFKVDLDTDTQTLVSSNTSTQGMLFDHPVDVAVDGSGRIILPNTGDSTNNATGSVIAVNPQTGIQSLITTFGQYSGTDAVEVAPSGQILVGNISGSSPANIIAVNPGSGTQTVLTSGGSLSSVEGMRIYHATAQSAATTTAIASSVNPSAPGQSVTFTATVTPSGGGTPTGTMLFVIDGSNAGSASLTGAGGQATASYTTSSLSVGTHTITAIYGGDSNFAGSTGSLANGQIVKQVSATSTSTAVTSSANPSAPGQSVTFTATVTPSGGGTPTGTVLFVIDGSNAGSASLTSAGGRTTATYTTSSLSTGTHTVTAVYSGDSNFASSTGSLSNGQVVKPSSATATSTVVTSSANPSISGQSVTFTATVTASGGSGTPTGTVEFVIDGANSGSLSLVSSGGQTTAIYTTSSLTIGTHTISAIYSGDSNFASSTGSLANGQTVKQATGTRTSTLVASSANPSVSGQSVTFTATVTPSGGSGTPTGTVQFVVDGSNVGGLVSLVSAGGQTTASYTTSSLSLGTHSVTASYSGDSNFASSSGHLSGGQVVNQPALSETTTVVSSSANPSVFDQGISFTATVNPTGGGSPTGTVQFVIDSNVSITVSLNGGVATSGTISGLSVGTHTIQAVYSGDANFAGSTGSLTQIVNPAAATALIVSGFPSPTTAGAAGSVTVAAEDSSGNIVAGYRGTIYFGSTDSQASLPAEYTFTAADNGVHTFSVVFRTAGNQVLIASDIHNGGINGSQSVNVLPASADHLLVTPSVNTTTAGSPFDFTVTVQDAFNNTVTGYTGTVGFSSADPYGATLPPAYTFTAADGGVHTFSSGATLYTAGTWDVTATDVNNSGLTGSASVVVVPAAPDHFLVTPSVSTTVAGTPIDLTLTVQDAYNNTVTGYTGTVGFSSADPHGAALPAAYTFTASDGGVHTFSSGVTLYTVGSWSVTATDTASSGLGGSASVLVTPAAASHFLILAPSSVVAGTLFDVTIEAVDPYGNIDTNYVTDPSGVVDFSTTDADPGVVLPAAFQFTADEQGVVTFAGGATLITPGDQVLMAMDTASGLTDDGSAVVTVTGPGGGAAALAGTPPLVLRPAAVTAVLAAPLNGALSSGQTGGQSGKAMLADQVFSAPNSRGHDSGWSMVPAQAGTSQVSAPLQAIDSIFSTDSSVTAG